MCVRGVPAWGPREARCVSGVYLRGGPERPLCEAAKVMERPLREAAKVMDFYWRTHDVGDARVGCGIHAEETY